MAFRFFRRVKLAPGLTLNFSKTGGSLSVGSRGARVTVGKKGIRRTLGVPGTGIYWYDTIGGNTGSGGGGVSPPPKLAEGDQLRLGFFRRLFTPQEDEDLIDGLREVLQGNDTKAYSLLSRAVELADGAFLAGLLALKTGRLEQAGEWLESARARQDQLGRHFGKYRIEPAINLFITEHVAAIIGCDRRGVLLALAEVYEKQGTEDQAIAILRELHDWLPDDPVIRLSLSELLVESDGGQAACREAASLGEKIDNESPIHAALLYFRGRALHRIGLLTAARDVYTIALRRTRERPPELLWQIRYDRALLYLEQGKKRRGREQLERLYAENPEFEDVAARLGL